MKDFRDSSQALLSLGPKARRLMEDRDCGVVAISIAYRIPYDVAHRICAESGRRPRRGTHIGKVILHYELLRIASALMSPTQAITRRVTHTDWRGNKYSWNRALSPTLAQWLKSPDHRTGTYILTTFDHAFTVRDGKVFDFDLRKRCRIMWEYKLIPVKP